MKRLKFKRGGLLHDHGDSLECDEIVMELDHGRTVTLRRESVAGKDGITLYAGIEREDQLANARFVIRNELGHLHLNVEQGK